MVSPNPVRWVKDVPVAIELLSEQTLDVLEHVTDAQVPVIKATFRREDVGQTRTQRLFTIMVGDDRLTVRLGNDPVEDYERLQRVATDHLVLDIPDDGEPDDPMVH